MPEVFWYGFTNARHHSNFKIFNVSTAFTPAMVIENVLAGKGEPKGWAITEVVEKGDGAWAKVCERSELATSSENSKQGGDSSLHSECSLRSG
jgi:hypothetical protein